MISNFGNNWLAAFGYLALLDTLQPVSKRIQTERRRREGRIVPDANSKLMFNAFKYTPLNEIKVVIVGQEPQDKRFYNGLAFGNGSPGITPGKIDDELRAIVQEVKRTSKSVSTFDYSLYSWAAQGVLMMNMSHTMLKHTSADHILLWREFTQQVIKAINLKDNVVWMLWGLKAKQLIPLITNKSHSILTAGHPSPLNTKVPFIGNGCFESCNKILYKSGIQPIEWDVPAFKSSPRV